MGVGKQGLYFSDLFSFLLLNLLDNLFFIFIGQVVAEKQGRYFIFRSYFIKDQRFRAFR